MTVIDGVLMIWLLENEGGVDGDMVGLLIATRASVEKSK